MPDILAASLSILEVCVPILVVIAVGVICAWTGVLPPRKEGALHWLNKFVYYLGLPALLFRGLAPEDFFTIDFTFALSYLVVRVAVAILTGIYLVVVRWVKPAAITDPIGHFLGIWINTTWVNLLIFGVPILTAFMDAEMALQYNVLAALSSFAFQWPLMIFLFELRKVLREKTDSERETLIEPSTTQQRSALTTNELSRRTETIPLSEIGSERGTDHESPTGSIPEPVSTRRPAGTFFGSKSKMEVGRVSIMIAKALATNPTMIACVLALIYSLAITSHLPDSSTVKIPVLVDNFLKWLSNTVTPLSTLCIGLFMYSSWSTIAKTWKVGLGLLFLKNVVVPFLTIPLAMWFGFQGERAKALILMTSLPMAMASFPMLQTYHVGEEVGTTTVILGTLLMMPTAIAWNAILDAMHIF